MCWISLMLGAAMVAGGMWLVARFFLGRGAQAYRVASATRTETMVLGVALMSLGFLALVLGATGVICGIGGWR
jgi:hypothetical protein